jgi:hypothetical protein
MTTAIRNEPREEIEAYMDAANFGKRLARAGVSEEVFRRAVSAMFTAHPAVDPWWKEILGTASISPSMRSARYVAAVYHWSKSPNFQPSAVNWS